MNESLIAPLQGALFYLTFGIATIIKRLRRFSKPDLVPGGDVLL